MCSKNTWLYLVDMCERFWILHDLHNICKYGSVRKAMTNTTNNDYDNKPI